MDLDVMAAADAAASLIRVGTWSLGVMLGFGLGAVVATVYAERFFRRRARAVFDAEAGCRRWLLLGALLADGMELEQARRVADRVYPDQPKEGADAESNAR